MISSLKLKWKILGKMDPKKSTLVHSLVSILDLKEKKKKKNPQGIQIERQFTV